VGEGYTGFFVYTLSGSFPRQKLFQNKKLKEKVVTQVRLC
jgi:hypothetical protein